MAQHFFTHHQEYTYSTKKKCEYIEGSTCLLTDLPQQPEKYQNTINQNDNKSYYHDIFKERNGILFNEHLFPMNVGHKHIEDQTAERKY